MSILWDGWLFWVKSLPAEEKKERLGKKSTTCACCRVVRPKLENAVQLQFILLSFRMEQTIELIIKKPGKQSRAITNWARDKSSLGRETDLLIFLFVFFYIFVDCHNGSEHRDTKTKRSCYASHCEIKVSTRKKKEKKNSVCFFLFLFICR